MSDHPSDVWAKLAAPFPPEAIRWRQQGKPVPSRRGGHEARFVPFVDVGQVRERLDAVCLGGWGCTLRPLPVCEVVDPERKGELPPVHAVICSLSVNGVTREGVGEGADPKAAATDALKRAAVLFGIGADVKRIPILWVAMDSGDKNARPVKPPGQVYLERSRNKGSGGEGGGPARQASAGTSSPAVRTYGQRREGNAGPQTPTAGDRHVDLARSQFFEFNRLGEALGLSGGDRLAMMCEAGANQWSKLSPQARAELVQRLKDREASPAKQLPAGKLF